MVWLPSLSRENISKAIRNPRILREIPLPFARKLNARINRILHTPSPPVMAKDWDVLVILDACRADTFAKHSDGITTAGQLQRRVSPASSSKEFLEATFADRQYHDTVYVSANPYLRDIEGGTFHAMWPLLDDEFWNDDLDTVLPETVAEAGLSARKEFPNKRLILHFMQPHYPFIGESGQKLSHRGYNQDMDDQHLDEPSIWRILQRDPQSFDIQAVREAYEENLRVVLATVDELVTSFEGERIAITADHGNFLGERLWPIPISDFGHPGIAFAPETAHVPWYVISGDDRPEMKAESPEPSEDDHDEAIISDRLESLGYRA